MNPTALILLALRISIALSVFALGLKATLSDATFLFRRPRQLGRALLSMYVLMPLLAVLILPKLSLHPAVKIAIVALSVSPVPPIFPKMSPKAGATKNYAVGLLVAASLLAIIVVPVTMEMIELIVAVPLQMPLRDVTALVFKTTLAPLLAGIGLRAWAPSFAERAAKPTALLSSVLLNVCLIPVLFGAARAMLSLVGNGTLVTLAGFAFAGLIIGRLLGGPEPENRYVLSLATATRHPGLAAAIAHTNFPGQKLALPAIALYFIIAAISSAVVARGAAVAKPQQPADKEQQGNQLNSG